MKERFWGPEAFLFLFRIWPIRFEQRKLLAGSPGEERRRQNTLTKMCQVFLFTCIHMLIAVNRDQPKCSLDLKHRQTYPCLCFVWENIWLIGPVPCEQKDDTWPGHPLSTLQPTKYWLLSPEADELQDWQHYTKTPGFTTTKLVRRMLKGSAKNPLNVAAYLGQWVYPGILLHFL